MIIIEAVGDLFAVEGVSIFLFEFNFVVIGLLSLIAKLKVILSNNFDLHA